MRRRPRTPAVLVVWVLLLAGARAARAHGGGPHALNVWNWEPMLLLSLALAGWLYLRGVLRLWGRAGVGRGVSSWQVTAFAGGLVALFVALVSPVDALSAELFSVHMVQHLLLMMVAAPLLVLGTPVFVYLWALPRPWRQAVARRWQRAGAWHATWHVLSQPLLAWALYAFILWIWHVPGLYQAALRSRFIHDLQHLGFLLAAGLFWWILFNPMGRLCLSRGLGVLYLFTTSLHGGALGVLLTFSPQAWYPYYAGRTAAWNLTLLEDQQLAGLIMWMPACILYIILAAVIFAIWMREVETDVNRLERFAAHYAGADGQGEVHRYLREAERGG